MNKEASHLSESKKKKSKTWLYAIFLQVMQLHQFCAKCLRQRTRASVPLEVHVVPLPVVDFAVDGLGLGGS